MFVYAALLTAIDALSSIICEYRLNTSGEDKKSAVNLANKPAITGAGPNAAAPPTPAAAPKENVLTRPYTT